MADNSKVKWIDLSAIGLHLGSYRDGNKQAGLAILDTMGKYDKEIRSLGLDPAAGTYTQGLYLKNDYMITPVMLANTFPELELKWFADFRGNINRKFEERIKAHTAMNAKALFSQQRPIGFNDKGEVVQESMAGRFVISNAVVVREDGADPARFLRAKNKEALRRIARGFALRITRRNEKLRREHISRLITVSNEGGFSPREYQEAIEAGINDLFTNEVAALYSVEGQVDPLASYDVASQIFIGMPELKERTPSSMANQQYSTPVPMAALAQSILARRSELNGKSVLDPTIGNASLVTILNAESSPENRCQIYGIEIDPSRVEQAEPYADQVVLGDATKMNFRLQFNKPDGFDFIIANPPFGSLDSKVRIETPVGSLVDKVETARIDHMILLESLHARTNEGRAVFITGADSAIGNGEIKGRSKFLLNYLHDHYVVEGVCEVSGELYKKQGAMFPLRMYVVGARRAKPVQTEFDAAQPLPVIRSYEALRQWASDVIEKQAPLSFAASDLAATSDAVKVGDAAEAAVADVKDVAEKVDDRQDNMFQQRYIAFSNVGEPSTMIPANISGPVYESLAAIKETHGDLDEFVARELQFSVQEIIEKQMFSPEQMDALAMIFHANDRNLGFLLADQMGVGKGRVLAGAARRERLKGRVPVFVTVTPNLFSDFLERDIAAIGSRDLFVNPLIINDGCKTVDGNGDVVVRAMKRPEYRLHAEKGELPQGCDMVLLTYSQISRNFETHLTSRFMRELAVKYPLTIMLDESHNGAGTSNTSDNLDAMIDAVRIGHRGNVIYSSGTPIKGAKNLRLYKTILPKGVNTEDLLEAVQSDPLSLQEALNYEIAAQGCLISRELDNTGIEKEYVISTDVERNREVADQMADIFTAMSYLSGDIHTLANRLNKKLVADLEKIPEEERTGSRMGVTTMNFGSRLHELNRQMLLALKSKDVLRLAITALEANKKPIIALQHTGESLLVDFVAKANALTGDAEVDVEAQQALLPLTIPQSVSFKDLMNKYLEKITWITTVSRYGAVSQTKADSKEVQESVKRIAKLIDALPNDLPLTPLDYLREGLAEAGYSMGEVSGRNLQTRTLKDGSVMIEVVPGRTDKTRVNRVVREFNNGDRDVLVLTGSGSTGLSVQASPAVGRDVRTRRMIKLEMQPNIASERQMDGRHNRTGQIVAPEYCIPLTGLPADDRLSMMFNNKNRSLTSSTVANRDSKELIREAPDLLNVVGDMAAEEMLFETPGLAMRLDISLPEDSDERAEKPPLWFSGKLSGKMSLLKVAEQEELYAEWQSRFVEILDKLKAEGRNPLEVVCHEWRAKVVNRTVFMGAKAINENAKSQFNAPIFLTELEYERSVQAVRATEVDSKIRVMHEGLSMFAENGSIKTILNFTKTHRDDLLKNNLSQRFKSIEEALIADDANEVKNTAKKLDWIARNLGDLKNGGVFYKDDLEGKPVPHVILKFNLPSKIEGYARLGDYSIYTMQPGSNQIEIQSLSTLFSEDIDLEPDGFAENDTVRAVFDSAEDGIEMKRALIFDGNLFEATTLNLRERIGRKIVYTDDSGARQHGILIRSEVSMKKLLEIPERVREVPVLMGMLRLNAELTTHYSGDADMGSKESAVIGFNRDGKCILRVPGSKLRGGDVFMDPAVSEIVGKEKQNKFNLSFSLEGGKMVATIPENKIKELLNYFIERKNMNFFVKDRQSLKSVREKLGIYEPDAVATVD